MKRNNYTEPVMEIVFLDNQDIVRTSAGDHDVAFPGSNASEGTGSGSTDAHALSSEDWNF